MICPYCVQEVYATATNHTDCPQEPNKPFPLLYLDHHAKKNSKPPVVVSVIGFVGHGKTVFLCALFHYLDRSLSSLWPGFFKEALDQDSLSTLNDQRDLLEAGQLPPMTPHVFPRPGIFRLRNMPRRDIPEEQFLEDTTVLIYDPTGEAFGNKDKIIELASFVKRSDCVLFLVDLKTLAPSYASKMERLLGTYVLGMRELEIPPRSQHLIVVFTKSDDMKVSVPPFYNWLAKHPEIESYLNNQIPNELKNPTQHLRWLDEMSIALESFTANELKATSFINMTREWFQSVSYTAVSSLGTAPQDTENDPKSRGRLTVELSPRGVVDPLLYVLSKSYKETPPPKPWWHWFTKGTGLVVGVGSIVGMFAVILGITLFAIFYNAEYRTAQARMRAKDFREAIDHFTRSIESNPNYAAAYTGRGWAYLELGNLDEALTNCNLALNLAPDDAEALSCRGRVRTLKFQYGEAVNDCNEALKLSPKLASALQCRGFLYWRDFDNEKAIADYNLAIEQEASYGRAYFGRSFAYKDSDNPNSARADLEKAIELDAGRIYDFTQEHLLAYCERGRQFSQNGKYDLAVADYSRALAVDPKMVEAYLGRAEANKATERFEQSESDYSRAIELSPNSTNAYLGRADIRRRLNHYVDAIADYTRAIELNPDLFQAYLSRADLYTSIGQFENAILDCQILEEKNPPEFIKQAHMQWGETAYLQGRTKRIKHEWEGCYSESAKHYRIAAELDPDDPEPLLAAARADVGRNNWEEAIVEYEEAVSRRADLETLHDPIISKAYLLAGHQCRANYDRVKDQDYDSESKFKSCAIKNFRKAASLDSNNREAQSWSDYLSKL